MSIHIIIDGYNLIRQSDVLSGLERQNIQAGRDALVNMLAAYRKVKRHRITVVFDGSRAVCDYPSQELVQGINIVFSKSGEIADTVIKRMAAKEREKAIIVSSDQDIIKRSESFGCTTLNSVVFENKIITAYKLDSSGLDEESSDGWVPTTRKKGPSRRLPKRERQNRIKTRKL